MASMPTKRMGPPPRSLATDAYDLYERHRVNPFLQPMTNIFIELCSQPQSSFTSPAPALLCILGTESSPPFRRKREQSHPVVCPSLTTYPRRSPNGMRHSPHQLISGRNRVRTKVPHASLRGQRGAPRRMGPICITASFSHSYARSHIHLGSGYFFSFVFRPLCLQCFNSELHRSESCRSLRSAIVRSAACVPSRRW
jgi:hypothetical protein